jgi:hypothetical protein
MALIFPPQDAEGVPMPRTAGVLGMPWTANLVGWACRQQGIWAGRLCCQWHQPCQPGVIGHCCLWGAMPTGWRSVPKLPGSAFCRRRPLSCFLPALPQTSGARARSTSAKCSPCPRALWTRSPASRRCASRQDRWDSACLSLQDFLVLFCWGMVCGLSAAAWSGCLPVWQDAA